MVDIIAVIVMVTALLVIIIQSRFFRRKKRKLQKFPYFKLRDEIVWAIIDSQNCPKYDRIYATVNSTIENLRILNFSFYSKALERYLNLVFERAVRNNFEFTEDTFKIYNPSELTKEEKKLGKLLIDTARENSLWLRLATTKLGFKIFVTSKFIQSLIRFVNKHLKSGKYDPQFEVIKGYSYISHKLATV